MDFPIDCPDSAVKDSLAVYGQLGVNDSTPLFIETVKKELGPGETESDIVGVLGNFSKNVTVT